MFESAAPAFSRSDYRPSFLYWAARAHGKARQRPVKQTSVSALVQTDYGNSYLRAAGEREAGAASRGARRRRAREQPAGIAATAPALPTDRLIRLLLAGGLYDDAMNELRFAQRAWGPSTPVDATIAWVYYRKGELRRAITLMRRAYPQHLTSVGQELPPEILQVIFPLTYWDWIRKYSTPQGLDPYMIAALIAQESTFDPKVRSSANAWGLMQLVPATGRRLARTLGIPRFSTPMLTNPETNIRLGTLYFSTPGGAVRRHVLRAGELQRRREPRGALAGGAARDSIRTSSSTTSRFLRPRTTSSGSWERPKTIGCSTARAAATRFRWPVWPRLQAPHLRGWVRRRRQPRRHEHLQARKLR